MKSLLSWRKATPLHQQLGPRSNRFVYAPGAALPLAASPQIVSETFDAICGIDRYIGFTLSIGSGDATPCEFWLQDTITGWFIDYSYPGTVGAYMQGNLETNVDRCNLQFWFTADLNAPVFVSFKNIEIVPHKQ